MRKALLKTELAKPEYSGLTNQQAADAINAVTVPVVGQLTRNKFYIWCARHDGLYKLQQETAPQVRGLTMAVLALMQSDAVIDLSDPELAGMASALVAANVFSQPQIDDLFAIATSNKSKGEIIGVGVVNAGDVAQARA